MRPVGIFLRWAALGMGVGVLAGIAFGVAGQSSNNSATQGVSNSAPAWDPCAAPTDLLSQAGVDAATKDPNVDVPVIYPGWSGCVWKSLDRDAYGIAIYALTIVSTSREKSLDDERNDKTNSHVIDVNIGGRPALQFYDGPIDPSTSCAITFSVQPHGVVRLSAASWGGPTQNCEIAKHAATALLPVLPR